MVARKYLTWPANEEMVQTIRPTGWKFTEEAVGVDITRGETAAGGRHGNRVEAGPVVLQMKKANQHFGLWILHCWKSRDGIKN